MTGLILLILTLLPRSVAELNDAGDRLAWASWDVVLRSDRSLLIARRALVAPAEKFAAA